MKTVPFSDILASVCQLTGLDRNTLNDKAFAAIRDIVSRRISTIWDREEWPDTERYLRTWTGNPIQSVDIVNQTIFGENASALLCENGKELWMNNADDTVSIKLVFDLDFPRVYLTDFSGDAYKQNTIGSTGVKFLNPFYVLKNDGTRVSVSEKQYTFKYEEATDNNGKYISSIEINIPFGEPEYIIPYSGANSALSTKAIFISNHQFLVQLDEDSLQGIQAFDRDSRKETKAVYQPFIVEDFNYRNDTVSGGYVWSEEYSYLRFLTEGEKYIRYRKVSDRLFGARYIEGTSYQKNSQVYYDPLQGTSDYNPSAYGYPSRGDFWLSVTDLNSNNAPSETSRFWKKVAIPNRFKDFIINGASADFLRSEGRADEANVFEGIAEAAVQQQIDVLLRQQGQVQKMNMVYSY